MRSGLLAIVVCHAAVAVAAPSPLDRQLAALWRRAHVQPTPLVDDARFLRRVGVDLVGVIPTADEVRVFVADTRADKRAQLVDRLLATPECADNFARLWERLLLGPGPDRGNVDRAALRRWLATAFAENRPWDQVATQLIAAVGQSSAGGPRDAATPPPPDPAVNGAVNFGLRYVEAPQDLAGKVARLFLGVQIQCAQCHHHPYEKWSRDDFRRFAAIFTRAAPRPLDNDKVMGIKRVLVEELPRPLPRYLKDAELKVFAEARPAALDGSDLSAAPEGPRRALAAWLTTPKNPWFARATVNRWWAHLLGHGFVDPVDDFRASNAPLAPEILDTLARELHASKFDVRQLVRGIMLSRAYQATAAPASRRIEADKLWARYRLQPLDADELLASILRATNVEGVLMRVAALKVPEKLRDLRRAVNFLFAVDEEASDTDGTSFDGTIAQALTLANGLLVSGGSSAVAGGALADLLAREHEPDARIQALYLRTLSRLPSADELARWRDFIARRSDVVATAGPGLTPPPPRPKKDGAKVPKEVRAADALARPLARALVGVETAERQAYEDLFWALINSSEFYFQH